MTTRWYPILMDSVKLFFLNVFLYAFFLEIYILSFLLEERFGVELSFASVFVSGVFTFIALSVWINVAHVWYQWITSERELALRAVLSEIPFILLLLIFYLVWQGVPSSADAHAQITSLFLLFVAYFIAFPAVIVMAKTHREKVDSMR
ncbi:MAG: hypothetical protein HY422_03600 [Candidatus Komeilibacteria bacterium]|nr:hypothetical protein [Candidatus Komeilibacteria bacterium]